MLVDGGGWGLGWNLKWEACFWWSNNLVGSLMFGFDFCQQLGTNQADTNAQQFDRGGSKQHIVSKWQFFWPTGA